MTSSAHRRMWGVLLTLSIALTALMISPAGVSGEGTLMLKVKVTDKFLETLDDAEVYCVNVHTSARTDLFWKDQPNGDGWYEADVPAGMHQVFASKDGYADNSKIIKVNQDNEAKTHVVTLRKISAETHVDLEVVDGWDDPVYDAAVYLFMNDDDLTGRTDSNGTVAFTVPYSELHLLVFNGGMKTYSDMIQFLNVEPADMEGGNLTLTDNTPGEATTGTDLTFSADIIGVSDLVRVVVKFWYAWGVHTEIDMINDGDTWSYTTPLLDNTVGKMYYAFYAYTDTGEYYRTMVEEVAVDTLKVVMDEQVSDLDGSYRIMGLVKDTDNDFVADLSVHLWDVNHAHHVPVKESYEGSVSIPAYESFFYLMIEAPGYEPYWNTSVDLTSNTYFVPDNQEGDEYYFIMDGICTEETKLTTIRMTREYSVDKPFISTNWTMDANSRFWGTERVYGTPRMQVSGAYGVEGWKEVDASEVEEIKSTLRDVFGTPRVSTMDFFTVNGAHFTSMENYSVSITGLEGIIDVPANPRVIMSDEYQGEVEIEDEGVLEVEVLSLMENEQVVVMLPEDYEIVGTFDNDSAEVKYEGHPEWILVKTPLVFTAKKIEKPTADLLLYDEYMFHRVSENRFIVSLDENVTLSGEGSSDSVGIESYLWQNLPAGTEFIEGNRNAEKITVQFTQNHDAYSNITLKVKDTSGLWSTPDWIEMMPDGQKPTLEGYTLYDVEAEENLTEPYIIKEDNLIRFNATGAEDNGEVVDHIWTFGNTSVPVNEMVVEHEFRDPGVYEVMLQVIDAVGNKLTLENVTVTVTDETAPQPVIKDFSEDIIQGDAVELNGTQSYDPRESGNLYDTLTNFTWNIYMGEEEEPTATLNGEVVEYEFALPGNYRIELNVTDEGGHYSVAEKNIFVLGADLQINMVEFDPDLSDLEEDEKIHVSVVIENIGKIDAPANWTILVMDNEKVVKEDRIDVTLSPLLDGGDIHYYNFSYSAIRGSRVFKVYLDCELLGDNGTIEEDLIPENNEDNNIYTFEFSVPEESPWFEWWYVLILIAVIIVIYVIYMKYTKGLWGYEPIVDWWNKRNA